MPYSMFSRTVVLVKMDPPPHRPQGPAGFWLPISGLTERYEPVGEIVIWMERDDQYDRFLGKISFALRSYHVEVVRMKPKSKRMDPDVWEVDDDRLDTFISKHTEGDAPQTFKIEGYPGEWVACIVPFGT